MALEVFIYIPCSLVMIGQELQAGGKMRNSFSDNRTILTASPEQTLTREYIRPQDNYRQLLQTACDLCKQPDDGCFELSVGNPDKGLLPIEKIRERAQQFIDADLPLVITQVCDQCTMLFFSKDSPSSFHLQASRLNLNYLTGGTSLLNQHTWNSI